MKNSTRIIANNRLSLSLPAVLLAAALSAAVAQAQVTLTDGNSVATVNLGGGAGALGMNSWQVNGVNQLNQQWFWAGLGTAPQRSIDTLGSLSFSSSGNFLTATYTANAFSIRIDYLLSGGLAGGSDWTSDITESISIQNLTGSPLAIRFYQYSDFDLLGSAGGDSVKIYQNGSTFWRATQTKAGTGVSETIDNPGANWAEAALYGQTLANLNGAAAYNLNNNLTAGPDNVTWALQWDFVIPANGNQDVFKDKRLSVAPIPEPGSFALIGLGVAALTIFRRRIQA